MSLFPNNYKVILIGNTMVGKTSILQRYLYNKFAEEMSLTTGIYSSSKEIILENGEKIVLQLFDTAGQERFKSISSSYLRNADGVLFVFSFDNKESFESIKMWMEQFDDINAKNRAIFYLVGNKNDLEKVVPEESVIDFLRKNVNFHYKSVSAKKEEKNNINELFQELGEKIFSNNIGKKEQTFNINTVTLNGIILKKKKQRLTCCSG